MSWYEDILTKIKKELARLWDKITGNDSEDDNGSGDTDSDDIDLSKADWHQINGAGAQVTEQITALTFDGKYFHMTTTDGTKAWPSNSEGLNQYSCFFVKRNGIWTGGKFEWQRPSNTPRGTENINSGYTDGIKPKVGETVAYCQIRLSCTERTTCKTVIWK